MKLTECLDFSKPTLLEMVAPADVKAEEWAENIRLKLMDDVSPKLHEHLKSLELEKQYSTLNTQQEIEDYQVEHISADFKRVLAEYVETLGMNEQQEMFIYDTFLVQYHQAAIKQCNQVAMARMRYVLNNQPKIITS